MVHLWYTFHVPTLNPRVNVVLERPVYEMLRRIARHEDVSLSSKAYQLIREALEVHEDVALGWIGEERERTFKRSKALSHEQVWGRGKAR